MEVRVADDGTAVAADGRHGHGIDGMRERAALHHGTLSAGPAPGGGWLVSALLYPNRQAQAVTS
jgi:signal transduction histidine kinase